MLVTGVWSINVCWGQEFGVLSMLVTGVWSIKYVGDRSLEY